MGKTLKTLLSCLLALMLALSLVSVPASASSDGDVEEWDSETELRHMYDAEKYVLMETDTVRISAGYLSYISTDRGMMLWFSLNTENYTEEDITISFYENQNTYPMVTSTVAAGEIKYTMGSTPNYEWNCLLGETEDCYLGSYMVEVIDAAGHTETVQYDLYASKKAPFANVVTENEESSAKLETYAYPTSDDLFAFMQEYGQDKPAVWSEPDWEVNDGQLTVKGTLMPDRENFIDLSVTVSTYSWGRDEPDEEELAELLLDFYQEITDKSGLEFDGAEDSIKEVFSLEDTWYNSVGFVSEGYQLDVIATNSSKGFSLSREFGEYGEIPYTPADVLAYLQDVSEKDVTCERRVEFGDLPSMAEDCPYTSFVKLDGGEHVFYIEAQYHGTEPEEARTYFEDLAALFFTGETNEKTMDFIDDCYSEMDPEDSNGWSCKLGRDYTVSMVLGPSYSDMDIEVKTSIPEDAPVFPNEEEAEGLLLDPIARLGIDKDIEVPETVLFAKDDVSIVLERALYTEDQLYLICRMENVPEGAGVDVSLKEMNGSKVWDWERDHHTITSASLYESSPHEEIERKRIWLSLSCIKDNVPDCSGISTLSLVVTYRGADVDDEGNAKEQDYIITDPVIIETGY